MTPLQFFLVILYGVLATADPGVLEGVQDLRLRYGYGLTETAPANVVLLGLEDCAWLGHPAVVVVDGVAHEARVVDCQQREHRAAFPMSGRKLVGDVNWPELNHKQATVMVLR